MILFKYIIFHINGKQLWLWQIFLIFTVINLQLGTTIYIRHWLFLYGFMFIFMWIFLFCVVFFYMCIVLVIFCTFIHLTTVFHETAFGWEPRVFIITQSNFFSPFPILISPLHLNTNSVITVRVHTFLNGSDQC